MIPLSFTQILTTVLYFGLIVDTKLSLHIANSDINSVDKDNVNDDSAMDNDIPLIHPHHIKSFKSVEPKFHTNSVTSLHPHKYHYSVNDNLSENVRHVKKKTRLLRFLWNFRLDVTKFDTTCLKREGRGFAAPYIQHGRIVKYSRRRNRAPPRNHYDIALYECEEGFEMPQESSDRMFCSKNKWVGPTPVCLPKSSLLDESECNKCEQICTTEENSNGGIAGVTCSCYAGYEMLSNGTCGDIDECAIDNGGCSEICFNKPGSFQCFCPSGYRVGPEGTCIDRNECLLRNGHGPCQDSCLNVPGSYVCSCQNINGTRLASDKHSCEDINECEEKNNFGCSHGCLNTFGNAFCTCPKGFILSTEDYKTCVGGSSAENLEISSPATPLECPPGSAPASDYYDKGERICIEFEDCSEDNGGCDHECIHSGDFRFCACRDGYELFNETACVDVNECEWENGGCAHECVNTPGSFYCKCASGYRVDAHDKKSCLEMHCDAPPITENVVGWECENPTSSNGNYSDLNKFSVGTRCRLQCLPGYSLEHSSVLDLDNVSIEDNNVLSGVAPKEWIKCEEGGTWNGLETAARSICVLTSCQRLQAIEHGSIYPESACLYENSPVNTQCLIICENGYYAKNGRIRTCTKEYQWFPEENALCVPHPRTPPPHIHCPSDLQVDLQSGQRTAYVKIPQPQANMDWHRYVDADPPWAKTLEGHAPPGKTQITFIARSPLSNETASCSFTIYVVDREAPRVHGCPTSFEIRLGSNEGSREVWWAEPKFSDNVHVKFVQQSHTPGLALSRGNHHIGYVAGDAEGNKARCSFTVTVHGSKDYEVTDRAYHHHPTLVVNRPNSSTNIMIICPNLKTGRWIVHYAYYLPPGCRYSPPTQYYASHSVKQKHDKQHHSSNNSPWYHRQTASTLPKK